MKITYASYTDTGDREINEDSFLCLPCGEGKFFAAVADGLGGHGLGDVASGIAVHTAYDVYKRKTKFSSDDFNDIYDKCQEALLAQQISEHAQKKMRTTLNLLCIDNNIACWSHIGDSRTYYFKDGKMVKRTIDHSVPQMLVSAGEIEEREIRFHEDRNRLLKALGIDGASHTGETEEEVALSGGQQFLLCSDGFWERITEEQIELCLDESDDPQLWIDNMIELATRNRREENADNTTVVAVWTED